VHDSGRDDGHNDDAINDSGGSGNMVVMGETHEARPDAWRAVETNHYPY